MTPYRYGASFVDPTTGLRFEMHHPASRPDRWSAYLDGAAREYERYGIGGLVDLPELERGEGVSLFFVGVDADDRVVAGLRCHGPLDDAAASAALAEMAASPEWRDHQEAVASISPYGVVEMKGAWRSRSGNGNHAVTGPMVRCCVHAIEWLGAEVLLAAVADRMEPILASVGGIMMGNEASPYPTERYRTILTGIRRARYRELIDDEQAKLLREDAEQLRRPPENQVTTGWRPVLLHTERRAHRQIISNLRADPGIHVIDVAERQRAELVDLLPVPEQELVDEPPVHVYFPWRRTVVRMLGPHAFSAVRLDRNRNRITRAEQDRLRHQRVGIVGLSAGHAAAAAIALEGLCGELKLADFDEVALTNLNRLPASVLDIGVNKAVVAARRVAEIDPYLSVDVLSSGLDAGNVDDFVAGLDVLVEECDDIAMKVLVREVARRQHVAVVMETSDRGMLDVERFDQEPDRPVLHGLLGDVRASSLASLSTTEKIPHVLAIVDAPKASARGAASLAEIGRTLSTWPQLGSDVSLGGATIAATVRRLGLGEPVPSGRVRIDLETIVSSLETPVPHDSDPDGGHASPRVVVGAAPAAASSVPPDRELAIVHAAAMAPSCGNGQPWRFELSSRELAIELDRSKGCGTMDVRSRASYVGIGAALFNARVAAAAGSRLGPTELFPEGPNSDVVATLALERSADAELAALYAPMLERCSNRRLGTPTPLDVDVVARLTRAASEEGGTLHLVTDRQRMFECADILGATERVRFLTPALREETVRELRWPGDDVRSGIDVATLELSGSDTGALALLRRGDAMELLERWDAGDGLGDYLKGAVRSSSALAYVTVESSSPASYVTGGMALERVWIEAQRAGLAVQAIGPAFLYAVQQGDYEALVGPRWSPTLRELAERFRRVVGLATRTVGVLVLRLSHAPPPMVRSARLPLDSMLRRRGTTTSGAARRLHAHEAPRGGVPRSRTIQAGEGEEADIWPDQV